MERINRVLIYSCELFNISAKRACLEVEYQNGHVRSKFFPDVEDLFTLPMNGLITLVKELAEEVRKDLGA